MNFTHYQTNARATAIYPHDYEVVYPVLGLTGEAGEVAEKIKKQLRGGKSLHDEDFREAVVKELGDVLWYISNLASDLHVNLDDVARINLEKLAARKQNNTIQGDGDNR